MSKHEEAGLILKLYELRREETMRKARDWYFMEFNPESFADFMDAMMGERGAYLRMVLTYWDMAAALVNHGAISASLYNDTNGEHLGVFAKIEPFLGEIRAAINPQFADNLEKLIEDTPNGRERVDGVREGMKRIRAEVTARRARTAQAS